MTLNFGPSCLWDYRPHLHTQFPAVLGLKQNFVQTEQAFNQLSYSPGPIVNHCAYAIFLQKRKNHREKVTRLRNSTSAKELRGGRWCQSEPTAAWTGKELRAVFLLWKPIPVESLGLFKPNAFTAWNEWLHDLSLHACRPCCYTWSLAALGASRK